MTIYMFHYRWSYGVVLWELFTYGRLAALHDVETKVVLLILMQATVHILICTLDSPMIPSSPISRRETEWSNQKAALMSCK